MLFGLLRFITASFVFVSSGFLVAFDAVSDGFKDLFVKLSSLHLYWAT